MTVQVRPVLQALFRLSSLLLATLLALSTAAHAHRKTDVITLYNGDRLTGEIISLQGARLTLNTDAMGNVSIEWQEIAELESNFNYELRIEDGQRFFGTIGPGSVPGTFTIVDVFGERSFSGREIVELRPVEDEFLDRLDVYVSANYAFTKASGVTQTEFRTDVSYETQRATNALTSRITVSDTDENRTTSSRTSLSRTAWTDRAAQYRIVFGGFETNDELALDYRITAGAGVGRFFIDTNNSTLKSSIALQALEERSVGGDEQQSMELVLSLDYVRWRFDSPELDLTLNNSIYPSLTESGRVRADTTARLRWEIWSDLYWDFSAWGSYDSSAIDEEAGEFDWGMTTGLGWDF